MSGGWARRWLLYGAYGYTGRLIAERAVNQGHSPILAGRDGRRLTELSERLGLESRVFGLNEPATVRAGLDGACAVLHAAGPFESTSRPMVDACLEVGCHYLDVTGELAVLEEIMARDREARDSGLVLLPGMGFDVVPTDCLAAAVVAQVPAAESLDIAFVASGRPSGGSLKGILDGLARPGAVRVKGRITEVPQGSIRRTVPFSDRPRDLVAIPWGDVSTAWHSTKVPNVRVFTHIPRAQLALLKWVRPIVGNQHVRAGLKAILSRTGGPGAQELASGWARVWAEAKDAQGTFARAEITIPNGYAFTADSALVGVLSVLEGRHHRAGALTPSAAFGAGFVDSLEGVAWIRRP